MTVGSCKAHVRAMKRFHASGGCTTLRVSMKNARWPTGNVGNALNGRASARSETSERGKFCLVQHVAPPGSR
ncbi:Hypothetical protein OINT_2001288 [Brucella intermedia LMG 3301]|uniref:Uncharacterized protein n=1 Tax=Brucella intermedia LMG 3301 TaxID=641118 RepID=C4WP05_9HYPH|nr:Hypothetical protein OINT_2001288 [Brucella intermedia LMG 3301]